MAAPTEMLKKANMHHQAGQLEQATLLYRQLLAKNPKQSELYLRLADIYLRQGKHDDTFACLKKAHQLAPENPSITFSLAATYHQLKQLESALEWYQATLKLSPGEGGTLNNMGSLLREMGRHDEAIDYLKAALPNHPVPQSVWQNLGNVYLQSKRFDEAEHAYQELLKLQPASAEGHMGLGKVYYRKGLDEESLAAFKKAAEMAPDDAIAAYQLGLVYKRVGELDLARENFSKAVALKPNYPEAHMGIAMSYFMQGNFEKAWPEYEWRLRLKGHSGINMNSKKPQWRGEPLEGKTLVVHTEQGFGDAMQFIRFLHKVKALNPAKIIMIVTDELGRLFTQSPLPIDQYISASRGQLPAFDYHIPLLSIPGVLKLQESDLGMDSPYLCTVSGMNAMWSHQIPRTSRKQIGIVWTGRPTHSYNHLRSVPVALLGELTATPGTRWISLQKDLPQPELPGEWFEIFNPPSDFADTAAMIHCLDLVITIDTSVAHLAGALGKPTWLLLDTDPDWRWFRDRADSPWYPSVRIFRQKTPGDWAGVMAEVKQALQS